MPRAVDLMRFDGLIDNALRSQVRRIKVETAYGPPIVLDEPFTPSAPSWLMKTLRPKITLHLRDVSDPIVIAPHGAPGATAWPWVSVVGLATLGLAAYGLATLLRR